MFYYGSDLMPVNQRSGYVRLASDRPEGVGVSLNGATVGRCNISKSSTSLHPSIILFLNADTSDTHFHFH